MSISALQAAGLPQFSQLDLAGFEARLDGLLAQAQERLATVSVIQSPTWRTVIEPLFDALVDIQHEWSPVVHLSGVMNSDELRVVYDRCVLKLDAFYTQMNQNQALYQQFELLNQNDEYQQLSVAQQQVIRQRIRDFKLSGVALTEDKRCRFADISKRLTQLSSQFSNNVMDSAEQWRYHTEDAQVLAGLSENFVKKAEALAKAEGQSGYLLKLDYPTYLEVVRSADQAQLRYELGEAWLTRGSEIGAGAETYDNTPLILETLQLRHEMANLLEYPNYAEYSVAAKMAKNTQAVMQLLEDMAQRCRAQGLQELNELRDFAHQNYGITKLNTWDIAYFSEKFKKDKFQVNSEVIKPYLPLNAVLKGLITLLDRLFDVQVIEVSNFDRYHDELKLFCLERHHKAFAYCYADFFARMKKRSGAWMGNARSRVRLSDGQLQLPVAYITCNFTPPTADQPSLLSHEDMITLFHEFGHALHHMLTEQEWLDVTGIHGVAWDAVELPSQIIENWCWEPEVLSFASAHYQTGEPLPQALLDKLIEAKHFNTALAYLRQLVFSIFDFRLHAEFRPENPVLVTQLYDEVAKAVDVRENPDFNRTPHSFSHIFSGGYAAGYYSYLWAEVLSADAFSRFEEEGVLNAQVGHDFVAQILAKGGSEDAEVLFQRFRGRAPQLDALLKHAGIKG